MSSSYTLTETKTFTATHAKHMAAKVKTDLRRIKRLYGDKSGGEPNDRRIEEYEMEIIELLKGGYLNEVTYGFQRNGNWIAPTVQYTARELGSSSADDDDPGRIKPGGDISGATFCSFLTYSDAWSDLSESEKNSIKRRLPFSRTTGSTPGVDGYMSSDRTYSSGGRSLERASVRSY